MDTRITTVQVRLKPIISADYAVTFNPLITDWFDFYTTELQITTKQLNKVADPTFEYRIKPASESIREHDDWINKVVDP